MLRPLHVSLLNPFVRQRLVTFTAQRSGPDLRHLAAMLADGTLVSVIDRTFSLAEVPAAMHYLETGRTRGKSVITG